MKTTLIRFLVIAAVSLNLLGCGHRQQLTLKVFVDGSDLVKVNGNKLWLEHETYSLPGPTIYLNNQTWSPKWNDNTSSAFEGLIPALNPHSQKIQVVKRKGRGAVSVVEVPNAQNDQTLTLKINDDDFNGADWYEIAVSW